MKASRIGGIAALGLTLSVVSCTDSVRQGTGASFLIVERMLAASGAAPDEFGGTLQSDVVTIVNGSPTIFLDLAEVTFSLGQKDPARATTPTQNLHITVDRYHVRYIRADGRNTPGIDVPHPFDGSVTVTVRADGSFVTSFPIVRHVAKQEAPLGALAFGPVIISTIAEVTFFGRDQVGHEVTATARIGVDFGNFADPASESSS
jgi:hypothetical protein